MALGQKRMIYTNLWQNLEFSSLSDRAKLLYIGTITVADDDGRLRGNSILLRSQIFPLDEKITVEDVRKWLNEIVRAKLITYYKVGTEYFIQHPNWEKYQYIRADIYKKSKIPTLRRRNKNVTESLPSIVKDSKDKRRREEPKITASIKYLKNIPEADMNELIQTFKCERSEVITKGNTLHDYCHSKGRVYKNYRAFLSNALRTDFGERPKRMKTPIYDTSTGTAKIIGYKE